MTSPPAGLHTGCLQKRRLINGPVLASSAATVPLARSCFTLPLVPLGSGTEGREAVDVRRKSVVERAVWKLSPGGPTTGSGKQVGRVRVRRSIAHWSPVLRCATVEVVRQC